MEKEEEKERKEKKNAKEKRNRTMMKTTRGKKNQKIGPLSRPSGGKPFLFSSRKSQDVSLPQNPSETMIFHKP